MVAGPLLAAAVVDMGDPLRLERLHSCASTLTRFDRLDSAASSGPAIQFIEDRLFTLHLDDLCERLSLTLPQVEAAPIGVGAHGTVFRAVDDATGAAVALKVVWDAERFRREVSVLEAIRSKRNVVQLLRAAGEPEEGGLMGLVLRLAPLTLRDVVENCGLCIREGRTADLVSHADYVPRAALDVLAGLTELHQAGYVHGDVHPANILVGADGTARLADFGEASPVSSPKQPAMGPTNTVPAMVEGECEARGATVLFADPERIDEPPTERSDVHAFALTLLCLATGLTEPPDLEDAHLLRNPELDDSVTASLAQLLTPCFQPHDDRPTAQQLLALAETLFPCHRDGRRRGSWPPEALRHALSGTSTSHFGEESSSEQSNNTSFGPCIDEDEADNDDYCEDGFVVVAAAAACGEEEESEDTDTDLRKYRSADYSINGGRGRQKTDKDKCKGEVKKPRVHWQRSVAWHQCPVRQALLARCRSLPALLARGRPNELVCRKAQKH